MNIVYRGKSKKTGENWYTIVFDDEFKISKDHKWFVGSLKVAIREDFAKVSKDAKFRYIKINEKNFHKIIVAKPDGNSNEWKKQDNDKNFIEQHTI